MIDGSGRPRPVEVARAGVRWGQTITDAGEADEGGFVAVWFAPMLFVIVGMAGFATDLGYWYLTASRAQNAADAAALAGVVYLPGDLANANVTATTIAANHGYSEATVTQTGPVQLRVTVRKTLPTLFVKLLGIDDVTVARTSLAEYVQPVAMGSPDPTLGNDPETGFSPQFWLSLAGPAGTKVNGDRFGTKLCGSETAYAVHECSGATTPNNAEYDPSGTVAAITAKAGQPLRVQLFDPAQVAVSGLCDAGAGSFPDPARLAAIAANTWPTSLVPAGYHADAAVRYAPGAGPYCTGDDDIGVGGAAGPPLELTVIVRRPDATTWDDTDNQVVCTATFPGYDLQTNDGVTFPAGATIANLLDPTDGFEDDEGVVDPSDGRFSFAEVFRRWVTVCDIPVAEAGQYIVQFRTNARAGAPLDYDPSVATRGQDRFSMRAGVPSGSGVDGAGFVTQARSRLVIYANKGSSTAEGTPQTQFMAARVLPGGRGRSLQITLFDMGDAGEPGTLRIRPGAGVTVDGSPLGSFSGCSFVRNDGAALAADAGHCRLDGVGRTTGFNGRLVTVTVPIPDGYDCDEADPDACWVVIEPHFPDSSAVTDFTTWTAEMAGSPVRLIE